MNVRTYDDLCGLIDTVLCDELPGHMELTRERLSDQLRDAIPPWVAAALEERGEQDACWGTVEGNPHSGPEWVSILMKQVGQLAEGVNTYHWDATAGRDVTVAIQMELVHVIAVAAAMYEQLSTEEGRRVGR